jgi:outer membrane receptor for ferrienterochelin and colicins
MMHRTRFFSGFLCLILAGAPYSVFAFAAEQAAQVEKKQPGLDNMSINELLNVEVVTTSKKQKRISRSPAIISTITSEEMAERGVTSLYEALSYLPGIEIIETYYGYTDVTFRGILQDHYNNKAVMLVNGQPLYDQIVSTFYLEKIPLSSIERIEVIRGPGGVLYGTNAFAGVINIITKQGTTADGIHASVRGGSFETIQGQINIGKKVKGADIFFAGEYARSDGFKRSIPYDEDDEALGVPYAGAVGARTLGYSADDPHGYQNNYGNVFGSMGYKGFQFNGLYFNNEKDKFGIIPTAASTGERTLDGKAFNARYSRSFLSKKVSVGGIAWFDSVHKEERVGVYPPALHVAGAHPDDQEYQGHKVGGQFEVTVSPLEKLELIVGTGHESSHADPYYFFLKDGLNPDGSRIQDLPACSFIQPKETSDTWTFIQSEFQISKFDLLAGMRFNHNTQAGNALIPSIGAVFSPTQGLSFKVLYGQGFRNPSIFEKYVRTVNILAGQKDLKPETIRTVDLGLDWIFLKNYSVRVNGFFTSTDNLITRRNMTTAELTQLNAEPGFGAGSMKWTKGPIYVNNPGQTYRGLEIEIKAMPAPKVSFFGNMSYKKGKDSQNSDLLFFAPLLANVGLSYRPVPRLLLSPLVQFVGSREGRYSPLYPWNHWTAGNYSLDAYRLVNLNITLQLARSVSVSIKAENLLDETYFYPEYVRRAIPFIPGGAGRLAYARLDFNLK